jgi:hypothetical protein
MEHFTLDLGAYRFTPDMHLPGDIILKELALPTACYEPSCEPADKEFPPPFYFNYSAPLRRIVDGEGMPAGYVEAVDGMVKRIEQLGGKVFLNMALVDFQPGKGATGNEKHLLQFATSGTQAQENVSASQVLLNLPRSALLALPSLRRATPTRIQKMQECVKFDVPPDMFPDGNPIQLGTSLTKAYAFYEDAWWHTKLNKTHDQWPNNAFQPMNTSQGIPIGIHWNDGPVRCDAPGKGCRGFLQTYYSTTKETFYEGLRPDPLHPLGVLNASAGESAQAKLSELHDAIMEATRPLWESAGLPQPTAAPVLLAVGVWGRGGGARGYTAPTKVYYSTSASLPGGPDPLERACGVPGLTEEEYRKSVLTPLSTPSVLVANNDWVAQRTEELFGDWAEESLLQTERGLRLQGMPAPDWLDKVYYQKKVVAMMGAAPESRESVVVV